MSSGKRNAKWECARECSPVSERRQPPQEFGEAAIDPEALRHRVREPRLSDIAFLNRS
jgi:hypothetical protein